MFIRFPFLLLFYHLISDNVDSLISTQSCADIIRPSQKYVPADPTLTIGTIPTLSYQECGKQCRTTTLCRTAVWCQGQCTMYQEYIAFGMRLPDLNCMLITLSGIAFNEIEPAVFIADNIIYEASQLKYYEHTYTVISLDECVQLCRLDSHCLTASYQSSTKHCSLFAEHALQGHNYTDLDWTTIILDTCAGRDSRIYPCLIDATQAHRKLCDLFSQIKPIKLDRQDVSSKPNGYTGWLTKLSIYWPIIIDDEGAILRASYDLKNLNSFLVGYEFEQIERNYFHVNVDQHTSVPIVYIGSKSATDNQIHRIGLTELENNTIDHAVNLILASHCQLCYFAADGSNIIYASMDDSDSIEQYDSNGQKVLSVYLKSPLGIILRNHNLWVVNNSHLIILTRTVLIDQTISYFTTNKIDLSSFYTLAMTNPSFLSDYSTFMPFHIDVDNYGRIYVVGALADLGSANNRYFPSSNSQLYIFTDAEDGIESASCAGPWGMYGVSVYHSKIKLRMLTSAHDFFFYLYSSP